MIEEVNIFQWVVGSDLNRISLYISRPCRIYYVDDGLSLSEIIKKCVSKTFAHMCIGYKTRNIYELDGDIAHPIHTVTTSVVSFCAWAFSPYIGDPFVRMNSSKRVVCYFYICESGSFKECGFS